MDTREAAQPSGLGKPRQDPGLGAWLHRNPWLLMRLFIVMVFTFGASTTAANFSYGLEGEPVTLSVEQINDGRLPPEVEIGDYVRITGTPDVPGNLKRVGTPGSRVAVSSRYSASYFYFGLRQTRDNLLVQTAQTLPDFDEGGRRVWDGKLSNVGTVIFHNTTQRGLARVNLPRDESIPVVETGDTPEYYRQIFPAYSAILGIWLLSIAWLTWKKNSPLLKY